MERLLMVDNRKSSAAVKLRLHVGQSVNISPMVSFLVISWWLVWNDHWIISLDKIVVFKRFKQINLHEPNIPWTSTIKFNPFPHTDDFYFVYIFFSFATMFSTLFNNFTFIYRTFYSFALISKSSAADLLHVGKG